MLHTKVGLVSAKAASDRLKLEAQAPSYGILADGSRRSKIKLKAGQAGRQLSISQYQQLRGAGAATVMGFVDQNIHLRNFSTKIEQSFSKLIEQQLQQTVVSRPTNQASNLDYLDCEIDNMTVPVNNNNKQQERARSQAAYSTQGRSNLIQRNRRQSGGTHLVIPHKKVSIVG